MLRLLIAFPMILMATSAHAIKCRNAKSILYMQDRYCPAGYTADATAPGGTVSVVGKSAPVVQQESEFLQRRATENNQYQVQIAHSQAVEAQQQTSNATLCSSLASRARSLESAMRQPNSPQWLDNLKQQHRSIRDAQYRNKC
ncbi:hypothetical protein [Cupriavidus necator]